MNRNAIVTGDGCPIAYQLEGDERAPVLMLSNSIATNLAMWDGISSELAKSFRLLRYDTRGHGGSGAPPGGYSIERLGRDVLELTDTLGIERMAFCGLSLGGMVGQWLAIHAPERINRLILSNTSPYLGPAQQWNAMIDTLLAEPDMEAMVDMFTGNWFPPSFEVSNKEVLQRFRRMIRETPPAGLAGCFAAVRDMDFRRSNALINTPTLVLGGLHDNVTIPAHSEHIAATIPGARLELMPGVHMLNVEMPEAFLDRVQRFLVQ